MRDLLTTPILEPPPGAGPQSPNAAPLHLGRRPLDSLEDRACLMEAEPLQFAVVVHVVEEHRAAPARLGGQHAPRAVAEGGAVVAAGGGDVREGLWDCERGQGRGGKSSQWVELECQAHRNGEKNTSSHAAQMCEDVTPRSSPSLHHPPRRSDLHAGPNAAGRADSNSQLLDSKAKLLLPLQRQRQCMP